MVLRRPYAFLIKHFKIIHLVLTLAMVYLAYKMIRISGYIAACISNTANFDDAITYVGGSVYLAIIVIIAISTILYILMRYKNKPKTLYLINGIIYIIIFGVLLYLTVVFQSFEEIAINPQAIRIYRDIVNIILYPEYLLIPIMLVRTLGFDIKKFDFKSDIEQMNIDVSDNEEVEVTLGVDVDKLKREGRRTLREFKYYVLENKFFVFTICSIVLVVVVASIVLSFTFINKVYKQGDTFDTSYFTMNITDSYITKKNTSGTDVSFNNSTYLIIKLNVKALYSDADIYDYKLDLNNFLLIIGNEKYVPTQKYYDYFRDVGSGYTTQKLSYDKEQTYILVYTVPNEVIDKRKTIRFEDGYVYVKKKFLALTPKIRLNPVNLDEVNKTIEYKLNDSIDFKDSVLDGTLKVSNYEFNKNYTYEYNYCIKDDCTKKTGYVNSSNGKTILRLEVENNITSYKYYDFLNNFVNVKYKKDGKEYSTNLRNKTPEFTSKYMYLDVSNKILDADSYWLEITVRNVKYKYILK